MDGCIVYVPSATAKPGDDVRIPARFRDSNANYTKARQVVCDHLGFGAIKVVASWSPKASWLGMAYPEEKLVLVNLAKEPAQTQGGYEDTILHELAHHSVGCAAGHQAVWVSRLGELHAALTDAKNSA